MSSATKKTTFRDGTAALWEEGPGYKKYRVVLYRSNKDYKENKKWKTVTFGDSRYEQYKDSTPLKLYADQNHLDKKRRDNYRARHGARGYQEVKYSPAWFSWNYLW